MPKERSTDAKLRAAAEKVLKLPRHKVAGWKRMVISYDLNHREKTEGTISHGTTSSTVTVYNYVWDEFATTTAEKVGDVYYLYANKFKYYEKGDTRTTLKKWILVDRFQTTRILEENIAK